MNDTDETPDELPPGTVTIAEAVAKVMERIRREREALRDKGER